jgi:hypothetical protein
VKHTKLIPIGLVLSLATLFACSRQPSGTPSPVAGQPGAAPAPRAAPSAAAPAGGVETVTGTVAETMDASDYTYVRVTTANGDVWAATGHFDVKKGDRVVVPLEMSMKDFKSRTLNRDFPLIYFASSIRREGDPEPPPMAVGHGASGARAPVAVQPVTQPAGGTAVAQVWARRAALAGKTVTVRGTVVKFNENILGRNWLHIQDGSGAAGEGTHDLTVTTSAMAKVGDVVTVTGTVAVDKDFGAGYAYKVMIEGATVAAK